MLAGIHLAICYWYEMKVCCWKCPDLYCTPGTTYENTICTLRDGQSTMQTHIIMGSNRTTYHDWNVDTRGIQFSVTPRKKVNVWHISGKDHMIFNKSSHILKHVLRLTMRRRFSLIRTNNLCTEKKRGSTFIFTWRIHKTILKGISRLNGVFQNWI